MAAEGRVVESVPDERYVWTWEKSIGATADGGQFSQDSSVTNVYRFSEEDGGTRLTLEESGHDSEEIRAMNEPGVDQMLDTLRAYVEDGVEVDWSAPPTAETGATG